MMDFIWEWLTSLATLTLLWVVLAELAIRRGERRKRAAADQVRKLTLLVVPYERGCGPHPWPGEDVVWVSSDDPAEQWAAIGGPAA